jgi:undecaprenyl pyrophosphate phosphatase UppP
MHKHDITWAQEQARARRAKWLILFIAARAILIAVVAVAFCLAIEHFKPYIIAFFLALIGFLMSILSAVSLGKLIRNTISQTKKGEVQHG